MLLDISNEALKKQGQWPWKRDILGRTIINAYKNTVHDEVRDCKCNQCEYAVGANYIINAHEKTIQMRLGMTGVLNVNTQYNVYHQYTEEGCTCLN